MIVFVVVVVVAVILGCDQDGNDSILTTHAFGYVCVGVGEDLQARQKWMQHSESMIVIANVPCDIHIPNDDVINCCLWLKEKDFIYKLRFRNHILVHQQILFLKR